MADRINPGQTACDQIEAVQGFGTHNDKWTEIRRYVGLDILAKSRMSATAAKTDKEVTLTAITV